MTQRLPTPGSDSGTWGDILNDFLEVSHTVDGTLANDTVGTNQLQSHAVTNAQLDTTVQSTLASVADKYVKPSGGIPKTDLESNVQSSLGQADSSVQTVNGRTPTAGAVTLAASDVGALSQSAADGRYIAGSKQTAAPSSPATDDLWYDSANDVWKRWSGSAWVVAGNALYDALGAADSARTAAQTYTDTQLAKAPLVVDGTLIREGSGGPIYKATGYNAHFLPNIYAASQTLTGTQIDTYFSQLRANSLTRIRAYAPPSTSGISWSQQLSTLDTVVNSARKHGQRLIFCFTAWGSGDQTADAFEPKSTSWVTGQQYLHSVAGANSYEDWVKTLVARYASDGTVCIYDICNEPNDDGSNTTAFKTWFDTTYGWIKAIDSSALVYVGIDLAGDVGGTTAYQTLNSGLDLCSYHYYSNTGFITPNDGPIVAAKALGKPLIIDEMGIWAKAYYGSSGDSDLDDVGWPAIDYEAQGLLFERQMLVTLATSGVCGVLVYSYMDSNGGSWTDGKGHYEPINESRARQVIRSVDLQGDAFSMDTLPSLAAWLDTAQAWKFAPGAAVTVYTNRSNNASGSVPSGTAPLAGRWNASASFLFNGLKYVDIGAWKAYGTQTSHWFAFVPTALPSSGAYCYLLGPQTAVASLAIRVNSNGNIELLQYSTATTGTVKGTSSNAVSLNQANTLAIVWNTSSGAYEIYLNGVRTTGTATASLSAANGRLGSAQDGTNGLVGHLLEGFYEATVETDANIGKAIAYLSRKYDSSV